MTSTGTRVEVQELTVRYGALRAVDELDLHAEAGEILAVLGPSGCGKSTLLRTIAGLERPAAGRVLLGGRDVTALRPDQRGVGLMFQDHVLFPHRSVAENVAFGLRMRRMPRSDIDARVHEVLGLVDLDGTASRDVAELSGGEKQRVALARAIAPEPGLLMLDEPLGSLDRALRQHLLEQLPGMLRSLGTTVLYVTHDQDEALAFADHVAVMRSGRLVQRDRPDRLWREPNDEFVARFIGLDQVFEVEHGPDGLIRTPFGDLDLRRYASQAPGAEDDVTLRLVLLADAVRLASAATSGAADAPDPATEVEIDGRVTARRFASDHVAVEVATDAGPSVRVAVWRGAGPAVDERVRLVVDLTATRLVPAAGPLDEAAASRHRGIVTGSSTDSTADGRGRFRRGSPRR